MLDGMTPKNEALVIEAEIAYEKWKSMTFDSNSTNSREWAMTREYKPIWVSGYLTRATGKVLPVTGYSGTKQQKKSPPNPKTERA